MIIEIAAGIILALVILVCWRFIIVACVIGFFLGLIGLAGFYGYIMYEEAQPEPVAATRSFYETPKGLATVKIVEQCGLVHSGDTRAIGDCLKANDVNPFAQFDCAQYSALPVDQWGGLPVACLP